MFRKHDHRINIYIWRKKMVEVVFLLYVLLPFLYFRKIDFAFFLYHPAIVWPLLLHLQPPVFFGLFLLLLQWKKEMYLHRLQDLVCGRVLQAQDCLLTILTVAVKRCVSKNQRKHFLLGTDRSVEFFVQRKAKADFLWVGLSADVQMQYAPLCPFKSFTKMHQMLLHVSVGYVVPKVHCCALFAITFLWCVYNFRTEQRKKEHI